MGASAQHGAAKRRVALRAAALGIDPGAGSVESDRAPGTLSASTIAAYLARGRQLHLRYLRETGVEDGSGMEFAQWMLSVRDTVSASSWRQYRAAAIHWLGGYEDGAEAADMLDAPRAVAVPSADRTSALKAKRLPMADLGAIVGYLRWHSRSRYRHALQDWLWAGILCGLRPSEWRCAEVAEDEDGVPHLYVRNAKATNGRGTGAVRTLDLGMFNAADLETVRRMAHNGRAWAAEGTFGERMAGCSELLYTACDVLWRGKARENRHYTLYSARHQFVSNMKSMLGEPVQLAALCGHAVTDTASAHYGRRRSAWPLETIPAPPRAVADEVARVVDNRREWRPAPGSQMALA